MVQSVHAEMAGELSQARTVMLIGAIDTGKTAMARRIVREAVASGKVVGYVDADIGNTTTGPPTCVGLKIISGLDGLERIQEADGLHFVGGISPDRLVLQQVIATAALVEQARQSSDLVIIDTTGLVSGVVGESLKYHKMELCRPDRVVAMQRGAELEPVVGMLRRFFGADVISLPVEPEVVPSSPDERASRRARRFGQAFQTPLDRWRVKATVFAPTLPTGLDISRLDSLLVGLHDGEGHCQGLGFLEVDDGTLRVATNQGEGMQGLRLGSLRIDPADFSTRPVNLREVMFGL
ncbi:MAG TPA: Clp1/GlmU family protein [Acidimicrobiia bacterium]|nr:Clp1/GlmU family protein [Acidimicrobiia bacterium]